MAASKSVRFGKKERNFEINQHKLIYKEILMVQRYVYLKYYILLRVNVSSIGHGRPSAVLYFGFNLGNFQEFWRDTVFLPEFGYPG